MKLEHSFVNFLNFGLIFIALLVILRYNIAVSPVARKALCVDRARDARYERKVDPIETKK